MIHNLSWFILLLVNMTTVQAHYRHAIPYWVALYPDSALTSYGELVTTSEGWVLDVYDSSNEEAIGKIETRMEYNVSREYKVRMTYFIPNSDSSSRLKFYPHYAARETDLYHLTLLDRSGDRAKVQFSEKIGPVWIAPSSQFAGQLRFKYLAPDLILKIESNERLVVVEYVNKESLIVRDIQRADKEICEGIGEIAIKPYTTWQIPRDEWITANHKSTFSAQYMIC